MVSGLSCNRCGRALELKVLVGTPRAAAQDLDSPHPRGWPVAQGESVPHPSPAAHRFGADGRPSAAPTRGGGRDWSGCGREHVSPSFRPIPDRSGGRACPGRPTVPCATAPDSMQRSAWAAGGAGRRRRVAPSVPADPGHQIGRRGRPTCGAAGSAIPAGRQRGVATPAPTWGPPDGREAPFLGAAFLAALFSALGHPVFALSRTVSAGMVGISFICASGSLSAARTAATSTRVPPTR